MISKDPQADIPAGLAVIDAHAHVDESALFGWLDPPEKLLALMDQAGIHQAIVMTYSDAPAINPAAIEYLAGVIAPHRARLHAFARMHPAYGAQAVELLRAAFRQHGMKGLKLHPVGTLSHPADEWSLALMRVAADFNAPVLFHCGDEPMTTPFAIAMAARQLPEVPIILGHMGGYFHVDDAIIAAESCSNIYLETSAMPYPPRIREAVERIGESRVLFASDGPGCNPLLELKKVLLAGLSEPQLRAVLGGNVQRLLHAVVR